MVHGAINRVLEGLGLEVSRRETPVEKVARVRAAVERYDASRPLVSGVVARTIGHLRVWFGKRS